MPRSIAAACCALALSIPIPAASLAQTAPAATPPYATVKVSDNVYYFRHGGHQTMFVVTPA